VEGANDAETARTSTVVFSPQQVEANRSNLRISSF
jgi:hypothetical protein